MKNLNFFYIPKLFKGSINQFIGLVLLLGSLFFSSPNASAQSGVNIVANPQNISTVTGQTFTVSFEVKFTGTPNLSIIQLFLNFDPLYLEVVPPLMPQTGILNDFIPANYNNTSGQINYVANVPFLSPPINSDFILLTVQFKAKAAIPNTSVTYNTTNPRRTLAVGTAGNILLGTTKADIIICPAATGPEINLQGNGVDIADGDDTPSLTDHTDFGDVATSPFTRTFTIQNTGVANLNITGIVTSGDVSQFAIGGITTPITPGNSTTFTVTFTPTSLGTKVLTISIQNNDCNEDVYAFKVQAKGDTYLPVELLDFNGKAQDKAILLDWVTASEKENAGFEVQRSVNGIKWQTIGFEKGYGTTSEQKKYKHTDLNPLGGVNYYRLRQLDFDSTETFHKIIAVSFQTDTNDLMIFPNPADNQIKAVLREAIEKGGIIRISDLAGRGIQTLSFQARASEQSIDIQQLPAGTYIMILQTEQTIYKTRFVKY